ncbi:Cytochrome P450 82A3 [Morella rubra]|uniref:Cytochrome P450 82A3 n=1 Tax=Morella rubra TaxID=262757 RepID=A0A6A1WCC8_9ROSI|nr:Cytochrome P450 82A3 [Morella rubra]
MSLNVILKMVAGKRYQLSNTIVDEKEARRCQKAVREFFYFIGLFVLSDAIPFLGWLDWGGHEKAMKKTGKELDSLFGKWLEEHKRKRASGEVKGEQDFMDVMLSVLDGADLAGYDADTINKATSNYILSLFVGDSYIRFKATTHSIIHGNKDLSAAVRPLKVMCLSLRYEENWKELDSLFGKWLDEHKLKRASGEVKGKQDFMDLMLSVLDGADLAGYDADTINKATSLNLIAGGSDTTTVTLTWAVSLLLNNHHVLKKAQDELDIHVGNERIVKESDISKLVYLQAILKETLRLYPAAPLSGPREFIEDCIIGGYHVPRGTRLITNIWKIQTDPRIWSDPLEFKPERFLTTHKDVDVWGKHFELIPFGSGRRACPGTSFALRTVHLALASFLHMFEISNPSDAQVDMTESFGLTNMKATPLEVLIKPRLPSTLYGLKTNK